MKKDACSAKGVGRKRLELEVLEERIAPTGAVDLDVVGGTLVITGDGLDNSITITQSGLGDHEYRIEGLDGTTVDGGAAVTIPNVTKGVILSMGAGHDSVVFDTATVEGPLVFDGGDGDNTLETTAVQMNGAVTITNGTGSDRINLDGSIGGNLTITNGDGDSDVRIFAPVTGKVSVTSGLGDDRVILDGGATGNVDVSFGMGEGSLSMNATVGGNLTVRSLDGLLEVSLLEMGVRKVSIAHGSGDSNIDITDVDIVGGLAVTNTTGTHILTVDSDSTIAGATKITNGDGDSTTTFSSPVINGSVKITNGAGYDALTVSNVTGTGGAWSATNGDGGSETSFNSVLITKALKLSNGNGLNDAYMDTCEIRGAVAITNGDGNSSTVILDSYVGMDEDHNHLVGGFKLQEGEGTHLVTLSGADIAKAAKITMGGSADILCDVSYFHGGANIKTGSGDDVITVAGDSWSDAPFTIDTGDGNDEVYIDDSEFDSNVTIKTGAGEDLLAIETKDTLWGYVNYFDGKVSVNMGDGDDSAVFGVDGQIENAAEFYNRVTLDGGTGSDSLGMADTTYFEYDPVEKNWEPI